MRFIIFAAQYLPTVGGVERYTNSLGATLVAMGHKVSVVTSALPGLPAEEIDDDGLRVVRLPARLLMGGRFPVVKKNGEFRRLAGEIFSSSYDFALINTRFYTLSLWAAKECHRRGIPAIVLEHGTKHLSLDNALLNGLGNLYEHGAMKLVRRHCDDFYGVSKACNEWLLHFGVVAKGVLYNAVDAAALNRQAAAAEVDFRERLGLAKKAPMVAFIGRFIVEKGVWELLSAFQQLRQTHPEAALVMAGDGPLFDEVKEKAQPGVYLTGVLPYNECIALMKQAGIFCLPTYSEGFSSTILEAAALGCCIITTPTGGSPELIDDGCSGLLLEDIRPDTIAAALARVLDDEPFARQAGAAVQAKVEARFTWQATAATLLDLAVPRG